MMFKRILCISLITVIVPLSLSGRRDNAVPDEKAPVVIEEINDSLFNIINGKSFKENEFITRDDLVHLKVLHYGFDDCVHEGELICNRKAAEDLKDIFTTLFRAHYQIESLRLIDEFDADDTKSMEANNSSAFNFRVVAGSTKLSAHAKGMAIDINPLYNPYVKGSTVSPESARDYADRNRKFDHKITSSDLACRLFIAHRWAWGGSWHSCKDYQHFEK